MNDYDSNTFIGNNEISDSEFNENDQTRNGNVTFDSAEELQFSNIEADQFEGF